MKKTLLLDALILLALALLGAIGYKLAPLLNPKTDITLPLSACDLSKQPCVTTLPDGSQLEFSIEPRPILSLKPLTLQATLKGSEARRIEVDFVGTEMKMGLNRPVLQGGNGQFTGQANLPVCITGTMEWDATVLVETEKAVLAIPFRFTTHSG